MGSARASRACVNASELINAPCPSFLRSGVGEAYRIPRTLRPICNRKSPAVRPTARPGFAAPAPLGFASRAKSAEKEVNAAWFRRRWHDGGERGLHAPDRLPALRARYDRLRS